MTILYVVEHYYPYKGGVEKLFQALAESLAKDHHIVVYTTKFDASLPRDEIINNVHIHRAELPNRYMFTFFGWVGLLKYASRCDVIHTTSYNAAVPAFIAAKLTRKKVIITFHEYWGRLWFNLPFLSKPEKLLFYLYERIILKLPFHLFIAVSNFTKQRLQEKNIKNVFKIYNGLTYKEFEGVMPAPRYRDFTFCYFGRLGSAKGLDLILPAFAEIRNNYSGVKLKLIIPQRPRLFYKKILEEISKLNLHDHITLLHDLERSELLSEVKASDVVLVPSYSEGFCFVAAETAALGVPIVHSGRGALKETVSGKSVQMASFDKKSLVQAMILAMEGKWDQNPLKKFELSESVSAYKDLYEL